MVNECFSMSLIANPLINEVMYWNTCGAVNNLSSLWKWKLCDIKEFGKFTTTVNIPMQPLHILGLAQLPIEYWIYFSNYQTLHNKVKEKKRKELILIYWCYLIPITVFLLFSLKK